MSETAGGWARWLLPAGLAALVILLVVIALVRGPVELDPDSAEGTVQQYLVAIDEERWDDAVAVIDPVWLGECGADDLSSLAPRDFSAELGGGQAGIQAGFSEEEFVTIDAPGSDQPLPQSDASVEVTITHADGGALGPGWSEYVVFELTDDGEFWWIVNDPWPYFLWNCRGSE
jgi:hypothetical protein